MSFVLSNQAQISAAARTARGYVIPALRHLNIPILLEKDNGQNSLCKIGPEHRKHPAAADPAGSGTK